jgi:hypothetical protein
MIGATALAGRERWRVFGVPHLVGDDGPVAILRTSAFDEFGADAEHFLGPATVTIEISA